MKTLCSGTLSTDVSKLEEIVSNLVSILWYIGPHMNKFKAQSCPIHKFFHRFCGFNYPKRHNNAVWQLNRKTLATFRTTLKI